jgi:hypothetical protein
MAWISGTAGKCRPCCRLPYSCSRTAPGRHCVAIPWLPPTVACRPQRRPSAAVACHLVPADFGRVPPDAVFDGGAWRFEVISGELVIRISGICEPSIVSSHLLQDIAPCGVIGVGGAAVGPTIGHIWFWECSRLRLWNLAASEGDVRGGICLRIWQSILELRIPWCSREVEGSS